VSFSEDLTAAQDRLYVTAKNFPTQIWKILDDHEHKELFDGAYFVSAGTDRQTRTELMDLLEIKKMSLPLSRMLSEARKACRGGCDGSAKASSKRTKTKHKVSTTNAVAYGLPPAIASTPRENRPAPVSSEDAKKMWSQTLPREFLKKRRRQVHRYHIFVALLADNFSLGTVALRLLALRRRRRRRRGGGGGHGFTRNS